MGVTCDQEIMSLIGTDVDTQNRFAPSLLESFQLKIYTQQRALEYMASKLMVKR